MSFTVRRLRDDPPRSTRRTAILGAAMVVSGSAMSFYKRIQAKRQAKQREASRINILKRLVVILLTVLCAVILFAATVRALAALHLFDVQSVMQIASVPLPVDTYGHTNILLLGQGDASHEGTDLTDTIMIASIDPTQTHSVVLLSLPRDLYFLETSYVERADRINTFYRDAKSRLEQEGMPVEEASNQAMRLLAKEVGDALNMEIHHVAKVDFIGFVQAVDALGGIEITVPETLIDTQYPGPNYTYETFQIDAGVQHIDGETALKYVRSRHSTSDFSRSARQQQILSAIAGRMHEDGLLTRASQISELLGILRDHVETTLTVREMAAMAAWSEQIDRSRIIPMQLTTDNGLYGSLSGAGGLLYAPPRDQFNGASVLLPVSIPEFPVTWKQIRTLVQLLIHERTAYVSGSVLHVLNAGAPPGTARRVGGELVRFGLPVDTIENAETDTPLSFVTGEADDPLAQNVAAWFDVPFRPLAPLPATAPDSPPPAPRPVTLMLGEDYTHVPLQDRVTVPRIDTLMPASPLSDDAA